MERAKVATMRDGNGKVEIISATDAAGKTRWAFVHWFDVPRESEQADETVDGPFDSAIEAQQEARARLGDSVGIFADVPDEADPLRWAEAPEHLRERIERVLGNAGQ